MFTKHCFSMLSILLIWSSLSYARLNPQSYQKMNEQVNRIEQKMANLPANEKKIDTSVLDKVNEMTEDNALSKYHGSELVRRYSKNLVKVNNEGKIRVVISMFDTTSRSIVNQLKNELENQNVQILGVYFPGPNINWYPEITCFVPYRKMKEIARDQRIAHISVTTNPSSYSVISQGDGVLMFCRTVKEVIHSNPRGGIYGRNETTIQQGVQDRSRGAGAEARETGG